MYPASVRTFRIEICQQNESIRHIMGELFNAPHVNSDSESDKCYVYGFCVILF